MVKAVREAMVHTRWTVPNLEHEQALVNFVGHILRDKPDNRFLQDIGRFANKIAFHGALNSLSQLTLKLASPGVADFYQGTELWDLRLVDPDNRKPVDFGNLEALLTAQDGNSLPLGELTQSWNDGRVKMHVTQQGLRFRRRHGALFLKGGYVPLQAIGSQRDCVVAFARRYRGDWAMAIAPRFTIRLADESTDFLRVWGWEDTRILMPKEAPRTWLNRLTNETIDSNEAGEIHLEQVFENFPVALLSNETEPFS
jgi:(1->4)-alpha-D-glucan 1-alpha-D-glucosylmutase